MDKYLDKINELIYKDKYTIRPIHLTHLFGLHIKQAQFLLECFVEKHKDLMVKYGLIGHQGDENDEIGSRRYIVVENDDIENEKKNFSKLISCTIKSIKEKTNLLNIDYPDYPKAISSKEDLINYQKKGFIINERTNIRKDKLNALINRLGLSEDSLSKSLTKPISNNEKNHDSKFIKQEKVKPIKIEANNKKPNVFSNFKPTTKPKDEPISNGKTNGHIKKEETVKEEVEKEEHKEFVKLKNDKPKESKKSKDSDKKKFSRIAKPFFSSDDESKDTKDDINDIEMDEDDDDEPICRRNSKQIKRSKIDSDSDEDSGHAKENIKHKNKKQKKKIALDSGESSEEDEKPINTIAEKKFRPPKEEESSRLIEQEETHYDEDGFKVTNIVKKIVIEKKDKKDNQAKEVQIVLNKIDKPKNKTEASPSETNKKPTTVKPKSVPKNQTSIMNFFKPKTQSK